MNKLSFTGHETFVCKQFWLKKGYDYLKEEKKFSDHNAVVGLGVGKNMVSAIHFWMKAFGLVEDGSHEPNQLAESIFQEGGFDPYIEDIGTLWLLHYLLVKTNKASIYSLFFNEFRKTRFDFSSEQLFGFLSRKSKEDNNQTGENSIKRDIQVFTKMYLNPESNSKKNIEDAFSGLFLDLNLIRFIKAESSKDKGTKLWYQLKNENRLDLPPHILLYVILDNLENTKTITLKQLSVEPNSPGLVFALDKESLFNKLKQLTEMYRNKIILTEDAGIQVLQFKNEIRKEEVLNDYYTSAT
jgi:hypothetical protein